jgi:hypothetical protein
VAAAYERYRLGYPDELVNEVLEYARRAGAGADGAALTELVGPVTSATT